MENDKRKISILLYYLLASSLVNLAWIMVGAGVLLLSSPAIKMDDLVVLSAIILFVLLQKGLIVGGVTYWFHKALVFDKASGTKSIGLYFGRFYCLIIGAFLGANFAELLGAIIGALSFYFVGRWAGTKIGSFIGSQIDRIFAVADTNAKEPKAA
jgi:hypothetical protein